jgi:hypothetical protein
VEFFRFFQFFYKNPGLNLINNFYFLLNLSEKLKFKNISPILSFTQPSICSIFSRIPIIHMLTHISYLNVRSVNISRVPRKKKIHCNPIYFINFFLFLPHDVDDALLSLGKKLRVDVVEGKKKFNFKTPFFISSKFASNMSPTWLHIIFYDV